MTTPRCLALLLTLLPLTAAAQSLRVDHHDPAYPAGFFDTLTPGTPVEGQPGVTWQHDRLGWVQRAVSAVTDAEPAQALKLGHAYVFRATGARVWLSGMGQLPGGSPVLFAICLRAAPGCQSAGVVWLLPAQTDTTDFVESDEIW